MEKYYGIDVEFHVDEDANLVGNGQNVDDFYLSDGNLYYTGNADLYLNEGTLYANEMIPPGKYVNKVIANGNTLIDLTEDTVMPAFMLADTTAHGADGAPITGTIPNGEEMEF